MTKPKIALVCDVQGWAYDNIAQEIKNNLSDSFEFEIFYIGNYINLSYPDPNYKNLPFLFEKLFLNKRYDLVHFFWRLDVDNIFNIHVIPYYPNIKCFSQLIKNFADSTVSASVYDHAYLDNESITKYSSLFTILLDGYTVSSKKLEKIYKTIPLYNNPKIVIQDGVNLEKFYPKNVARFSSNKDECVVGWVGNSEWSLTRGSDNKGLNTIITPALNQLKTDGVKIRAHFADRKNGIIPTEKMVNYYSEIDILLCASDIEGTPNPVLEAMACAIPVISTDVGIVGEVFGPMQQKFIIPRTVSSFKSAIKKLSQSKDLREKLSKENISLIKKFTREEEAIKWKNFFNNSILEKQQKGYEDKFEKTSKLSGILVNAYVDHMVESQQFSIRSLTKRFGKKLINKIRRKS